MAIKREWTEKEKQSLLKHITECKKGRMTIKDAAIDFSRINPHITPGQARVYYYKLINETDNFRKKYPQRIWTDAENNILFNYIEKFSTKKKIEVFDMLSERLNRHPKAIASHYYSLKNNIHKENAKCYSYIFSNAASDKFGTIFSKISKIHEIYEKAVEIESFLQKEQLIVELRKELQEAHIKIMNLEKKIVSF